jgi:hypothetical protein
MMRTVAVLALWTLSSCSNVIPPAPPAPHATMVVNAPFARTWDATIDVFAEEHIGISTLNRSSGFIVAKVGRVFGANSLKYADCGKSTRGELGQQLNEPSAATWNLVVRGDSTSSTVRASVLFVATLPTFNGDTTIDCSSLGTWKTAVEQRIKARAERVGK